MKYLQLPLYLLLFAIAGSTFAQQVDSLKNKDLMSMSLQELLMVKVDVGSKLEGLSQKDIPAQITIVSRDEIKLTGARNLPELISLLVPGAMAITDADDYIFGFRGFAPDNNSMVKLLINGQDAGFSANQGSSSMMALLDLNFIDYLEVITGPGSSMFGSGPLLGVINIVTGKFDHKKKAETSIGTKFGSGNFQDYYGHIGVINESGLKISADYSFFEQRDGYKPKAGNSNWIIPKSVIADNKYHESDPGFSFFSVIEKGSLQVSSFATRYVWDNYNSSTQQQLKDMRTMGAMLSSKLKLNDNLSFQPSAFVKNVYLQARVSGVQPNQIADYGDEQNLGSEMRLQYSKNKFNAVAGLIYNRYNYGNNTFGGKNLYNVGASTLVYNQNGDLVTHGEYIQMSEKKIENNVDGFLELLYKFNEMHSMQLSGLVSYDDAMKETNFSPRVAYIGQNDFLWWKAIYTRAFRTPIPMAVGNLPPGGLFKHYINKDLRTQTIDNVELHLGIAYNDIIAQAVGFANLNNGIIMAGSFPELVPGFDPTKFNWTYSNGGDINTYGCELSFEWKLVNLLSLKASHSFVKIYSVSFEKYLKAELLADFKGKHLFSFPENMTKFNITYSALPNLKLRSDIIIDYGRYRSDVAVARSIDDQLIIYTGLKTKSDNWYNINLGVVYSISKKWELMANLFNLLDNRPYQNVVNTTSVATTPYPRSFTVGVEYNFAN